MTDEQGPDPADTSRLRLAIARLYRQMVQASGDQDLTFAQLSALARVAEYGPLRLGELAAREQVSAPSMIRTVASLETRDLLAKEPDPHDRRSQHISVTPHGHEVLARVRRRRSELLTDRLVRLSAEQRRVLHEAVPVLELLAEEPERHGG
ncbi:MarR family winged helix-turn-helix transcriptional regulator [Streptomyces sp. NPDC059740]|uniref:MarR family winged helix-turn-helix transcriptional regulator n=1 Tax=Streptomyces sp. NPDC059740 TaxID=3346926 RepID=UPI00365CC278